MPPPPPGPNPAPRSPRAGLADWLRTALATGLLLALFVLAVGFGQRAKLERADFVMNNGAEVQTLDPARVTGVPEGRVIRALFEGLFVQDPRTLDPLPGMAMRHELSADGRTYTFHLRRGARWSDGSPFTASDFLFSWRRLLHPETAAEYAYQLWYVVGARAYSLSPDALLYARSVANGTWVEPREDGDLRLGLSAYRLAGEARGEVPELLVAAGDRLDPSRPFARLGGAELFPPVTGRVARLNTARGETVEALQKEPYGEAGWWLAVEPEEGALEGALASEALLEGERFRREVVETEILGLAAPDPHRFVVTLENPTPYFLQLTAFYPLFPVCEANVTSLQERHGETWGREWVRPENLVVNGPYVLAERRVNDRLRFVKNEHYWDADAVAMRTVDILAVEGYATMLNLYETGAVDWIDRLSTNFVPSLMGREDFDPTPYLGSYFYRVNVTEPPFDDKRVRRALALAIDRRAVCEKILKAGQVPSWSLVPPGLPGYELQIMPHASQGTEEEGRAAAYERDLAEARALLAEAGYGEGGRPFPTIEIHYNTSEAHRDIAEVISEDWRRHLGIEAKLLNQEWKVYLDTQRNLDYDVSRSAWIGDYPDPNTFLDLFVTGGENNKTGWGDARYDSLVERAREELDPARRFALLAEAEALLMEELPVLPIYYYSTQNLVDPRLGGWFNNVQDVHFFKFLYWMDEAELAATRAARPVAARRAERWSPEEGLYAPEHARER